MTIPDPLLLAALAVAGAFAGFMAGLLGIGGGLINVPVLTFVLVRMGQTQDAAVQTAVGTSLAIIVFTGISSSISYGREGLVSARPCLLMAPAGAMSATLVSLLAIRLQGGLVGMLFGVFLLLVALGMFGRPRQEEPRKRMGDWGFGLAGLLAGAISALFGVGGGLISVPMQVLGLGIGSHQAHANSCVLLTLLALAGVIVRLAADAPAGLSGAWGLVFAPAVVVMAPFSIAAAWAGAKLATRTDQLRLRRIFAFLLVVIGIRMIVL